MKGTLSPGRALAWLPARLEPTLRPVAGPARAPLCVDLLGGLDSVLSSLRPEAWAQDPGGWIGSTGCSRLTDGEADTALPGIS